MKNRLGPVVIYLLALLALSGCGSSSGIMPPPPPMSEFLYAMTPPGPTPGASFQLSTYKVDTTTGALSPSGMTTLSGFVVPQIAVDPTSKYLYISFPSPGANAIGIFTIDPNTGVPTQTSAFVVTQICISCPPISGPGVLSIDPAGKFLFYGSSTLGTGVFEGIGALGVNGSTGALSGVTGSPFPAMTLRLLCVSIPPGIFSIQKTLTPPEPMVLRCRVSRDSQLIRILEPSLCRFPVRRILPRLIQRSVVWRCIHREITFYATTGFSMNGIMAWSIDAAGALTALSNSPFQPGSATLWRRQL